MPLTLALIRFANAAPGSKNPEPDADVPVIVTLVELDPSGPKAWNALPGGAVWNPMSTHFKDEAELWRRNQTHPVPFLLDDVIAAKEDRTLVSPP